MDDRTGTPVVAPPPKQQIWLLPLLTLVLTVSYIDRTIVSILGPAIRRDLEISEAQLGLLSGLAFSLFYAAFGIPMARLAERANRVTLLSLAVAGWSVMTALSGMATSFAFLFLARIGVGVGEAGCLPASLSLISDSTPPQKRATAISIFLSGQSLGILFGAVLGGYIAHRLDWRAAFVIVGLPGILVALILRLVLRESPRGAYDAQAHVQDAVPPSFTKVLKRIAADGGARHALLAVTIAAIATYSYGLFLPAYFLRVHSLDYLQTGLLTGLVAGIAGAAGTIAGGYFSDIFSRFQLAWYAWVPAIGLVIGALFYASAFLMTGMPLAATVGLLSVAVFAIFCNTGSAFTILHGAVEPRMRATATAVVSLCVFLVGFTVGPYFTGTMTDYFATAAYGSEDFGSLCNNKLTSASVHASQCATAVALGTRQSLSVIWGFYLWAAVHYGLAGIHLARRGRDRAWRAMQAS